MLDFTVLSGQAYVLESAESPHSGAWTTLTTVARSSMPTHQVRVTDATATGAQRYYRLRLLAQPR